MQLTTSLSQIQLLATQKEQENIRFAEYLRQLNAEELDATVHTINKKVEPLIDCTQCGNCCKTLMIQVEEEEANTLAAALQQERSSFDEAFLEKGSSGIMIINRMPCAFLSGTRCSVYEHRFSGCREFPGLHLPAFQKRIFTVMMHYDRCPIVFNVIEQLKQSLPETAAIVS